MARWRRKANGKPFADLVIDGRRVRVSLVKRGERWQDLTDAVLDKRAETAARIWTQHARRPAAQPTTLDELRLWYLRGPLRARGVTASTVRQNEVILARFVAWCERLGLTTVAQLRARHGWPDEYLAELLATLRPGTANQRLAKVAAMFRAAYQRDLLAEPVVRAWPHARVPEPAPRAFTAEDVVRLVVWAHEHHPGTFARSVEFLARVGCRPSDVAGLQWSSVDWGTALIEIRQKKTGGLVEIPLTPGLAQLLREQRVSVPADCPWVFPTRSGQRQSDNTLTAQVQRACKSCLGYGSAKWLRAHVVTTLLGQGADRLDVARITGHASNAIASYYGKRQARSLELLLAVERVIEGGAK